jgi:hypothetical protein
MHPVARKQPRPVLSAVLQLAQKYRSRQVRSFLVGVCVAFPVGMSFAHLVLGQAWSHATRAGVDAMFVVVVGGALDVARRFAWEGLVAYAERNDPQ